MHLMSMFFFLCENDSEKGTSKRIKKKFYQTSLIYYTWKSMLNVDFDVDVMSMTI